MANTSHCWNPSLSTSHFLTPTCYPSNSCTLSLSVLALQSYWGFYPLTTVHQYSLSIYYVPGTVLGAFLPHSLLLDAPRSITLNLTPQTSTAPAPNKVYHPTSTILLGRNSLEVQWLGLCASTAGGMGSITGLGTKNLHATQHGQKKPKKTNKQKKTQSCSGRVLWSGTNTISPRPSHTSTYTQRNEPVTSLNNIHSFHNKSSWPIYPSQPVPNPSDFQFLVPCLPV